MAMSTAERELQKWIGWLRIIKSDVQDLVCSKHMFNTVQAMVKDNAALHRPSSFYDYMAQTYASYAVVGIRRQIKRSADSISFARLLEEMARSPHFFTRAYYLSLYDGTGLEDLASNSFLEFAAPHASHIDPARVQADLQAFKDVSTRCEHFADRRIAHWDRRGAQEIPTFSEVDSCIDLLDKLYVKYRLLFHAENMDTLLPTWQYDWQAIFRAPWIPTQNGVS